MVLSNIWPILCDGYDMWWFNYLFQTNAEIKEWIQENYHANFPLFSKINVLDDNVPEAWQYLISKFLITATAIPRRLKLTYLTPW